MLEIYQEAWDGNFPTYLFLGSYTNFDGIELKAYTNCTVKAHWPKLREM